MTNNCKKFLIAFSAIIFFLSTFSNTGANVNGAFIYTLSDFTGPIPYNTPRVVTDKERSEIYLLYQNSIRVFNDAGMEIYRFGDDLDLGQIVDVALDHNGDILLLSYKGKDSSAESSVLGIIHCNYRGEPKSRIDLKNFPSQFTKFGPNRMVYQDGLFYLASLNEMKIVITDSEGNFKKGYDLIPLLELEEKDRADTGLVGFSVDNDGNILFTIPVLFKAFILSPDGKVAWFGKPGGAPGRFNVIAGIVRDSKGNFVIVDKLKCAVMVFDKNYNFLSQFGYRGARPGNLIAPDDIAIDKSDRIYVTQGKKRGVSVFKLTYN